MKKLNKKGFTLVELLAVIIILAIVVGITIPAVMTTTSSAKKKAFQSAAQTTADWFERQYQAAQIGDTGLVVVDANYTAVMAVSALTSGNFSGFKSTTNVNHIRAAGLKSENIKTLYVKLNNGRACVWIEATTTGDYANAGQASPSSSATGNYMKGGNC